MKNLCYIRRHVEDCDPIVLGEEDAAEGGGVGDALVEEEDALVARPSVYVNPTRKCPALDRYAKRDRTKWTNDRQYTICTYMYIKGYTKERIANLIPIQLKYLH